MTDETKMTPEVAEAVAIMDARNGAWNCCRDYLHRVTAEHAELSRGYEKWKRSAESVGDDLRALRQRIADAPYLHSSVTVAAIDNGVLELNGRRARVLVDDGDA